MYRIDKLLKLDRKLYHTGDLATLWGMDNKHNLYMAITRYIDKGVLFPIHKGLYASVPIQKLDPLELGRALIHRYTYLSTETVLAKHGVISQVVYDVTFVADQSRRFKVESWSFRFRRLKEDFLFHPAGIVDKNGVLVASLERAAADMLYYHPKYHFDLPSLIDFERVKAIQSEVGYR